jgi:alpha-tubulin suppressor-like RCC1 family protein
MVGRRFSRVSNRAAVGSVAGAIAIVVIVAAVVLTGHDTSPTPKATGNLRLDPGQAPTQGHTTVSGGQTVSTISDGDYSTCALVVGRAVDCWGDSAHGQVGDGRRANALTPVHTSLGKQGISLSVGGSHACAVLADHTVSCWGANVHGELGDGSHTDSSTPVPVDGVHGALSVSSGVAHTCAMVGSGVQCWGANSNGQLGDGTTNDSDRPVAVQGLRGRARAVTTGLAHTCALLDDGSVDCWGANANGELGNGTTVGSPTPVAVTGLTGRATAIDAGDAHTCALLQDGSIECWGWNIEGQLGNGGGGDSPSPVAVAGLKTTASAIAAGGSHTCALLSSGGVEPRRCRSAA